MGKKKSARDLGRRQRQIMDVIYRLGEASVAEVRAEIPDPPSYSSVRTLIRLLESEGFLKHHREGTRYIYRPTQSKERAIRSALEHLIGTFFGGSASGAVAAILDEKSRDLSPEDLDRLESLIDEARQEKK